MFAGEPGLTMSGTLSNVAGGGGGAVGRIRVNTAATAVAQGTVSPQLPSTAATTGALASHPLP
jgi:hypothetical protein